MDYYGATSLAAAAKFKSPPKNIVITDGPVDKRSGKRSVEKEIAANKLDQQQVNNDVMLSGFHHSIQLDSSAVATKLFQSLGLPANSAKRSYHFETKKAIQDAKTSKITKIVSITCNDKTTQMQILKEARLLKASNFIALKDPELDSKIYCQRRLSRFNILALKDLNELKNYGIIEEIKFEGLFHHYKQCGQTAWKEVSHNGIYDTLKLILDNKKILEKKYQQTNSK